MIDLQESKIAETITKAKEVDSNKKATEKPEQKKYRFDKLRMYFGEPYTVKSNDKEIIIRQPTFGDILEIGEAAFYSTLYIFIGNPTLFRLQLWDLGVDWNKISDYDLFCMLVQTANPEVCKYLFESEMDFQSFELYGKKLPDKEEQIPTLYSKKQELEFSEDVYLEIREYLRVMFNINPKVEKAKGKTTKQWMIDEEREKLARESKKESSSSALLPMVSFAVNHPGFKFKTSELKEIGIFQFMDSIQRLQIYESTRSLMGGMYSGFADLSKVPKNQFNFMRDIDN